MPFLKLQQSELTLQAPPVATQAASQIVFGAQANPLSCSGAQHSLAQSASVVHESAHVPLTQ
jgi:hypothetical protein